MPGINVSALSGGDLRRLLKVAHARHDGLLADRLEWEIAARATSGGRQAGPFATLPDDEPDEPVEHMTMSDGEPFAPEPQEREFAAAEPVERELGPRNRSVLLVTLGAVAGSLLSAAVFWGLGRMDGLPVLERAQPTRTAALVPAAPEPLPLQTGGPSAMVEPPLPATTAPVEIARTSTPVAKVHKKPAATRTATHTRPATTQLAERTGRPPTLTEW
ncbi:MAG: hypothetical protein ACREEG_10820, partial [Phenylobacterium sp.]